MNNYMTPEDRERQDEWLDSLKEHIEESGGVLVDTNIRYGQPHGCEVELLLRVPPVAWMEDASNE